MATRSAFRYLLFFTSFLNTALAAVQVSAPSAPPSDNVTVVYSNFYGISLELSFINYYFGNDTSSIPQPVLNYLTALHQRTSGSPVRLRLGGNSMDSSTYDPNQQQIIQFTNPDASIDDQPVTYSAALFNIMKAASDKVGGVQWLVGLSLRDPNNTNTPLLAADAAKILGDDLDGLLLGNEPDLYSTHGQRPGMKNYTVYDYIGDYWVTFNNLQNGTDGDTLSLDKIAGPTICCFWDFSAILTSGWLVAFSNRLKYLTLQHYPQNNCFGSYPFHLDYYMTHSKTVTLARWEKPGLDYNAGLPADQRKPILMDEFNSASCGGIPESNMFALGLWSADYALQLASVGYSAAYLHTREHGVLYNVWDPPAGPAGDSGAWTTNPNFYAMLAITEALQDPNGSRVVDLNLENSMHDPTQVVAGYAIYDASSSDVHSVVLLNYANSTQSTDFTLPSSFFGQGSDNVLVRYMYAPSATETTNVNWGNITYAGVGDGVAVNATTQWGDRTYACTGGCTVQVPSPGLAVVFAAGVPDTTGTSSNSANSTNSTGSSTDTNASPSSTAPGKNQNTTNSASTLKDVQSGLTLLAGMAALCAMFL